MSTCTQVNEAAYPRWPKLASCTAAKGPSLCNYYNYGNAEVAHSYRIQSRGDLVWCEVHNVLEVGWPRNNSTVTDRSALTVCIVQGIRLNVDLLIGSLARHVPERDSTLSLTKHMVRPETHHF